MSDHTVISRDLNGQSFEQRLQEWLTIMPADIAMALTRIDFGLDPSDTPIDDNDATNHNDTQEAARE